MKRGRSRSLITSGPLRAMYAPAVAAASSATGRSESCAARHPEASMLLSSESSPGGPDSLSRCGLGRLWSENIRLAASAAALAATARAAVWTTDFRPPPSEPLESLPADDPPALGPVVSVSAVTHRSRAGLGLLGPAAPAAAHALDLLPQRLVPAAAGLGPAVRALADLVRQVDELLEVGLAVLQLLAHLTDEPVELGQLFRRLFQR